MQIFHKWKLAMKVSAGSFLIPVLAFSTPNANLPVPPSGWDAVQNVPHGTVTTSRSYPTRNHGAMTFTVHLPPGYSTATRYPVLYLLHGITDDQTTWTSGSKGRAHNIMDNLYAQNKATRLILVMPDGSVGGQGYDNSQGYADFEDVLLRDLIPFIEANYSASTDPLQRGLAGLSMGGGQTLNFGFKNYTVFNWIGAFSSAPNTIPANQTIRDPAAINANVRFTYLSCGTADGLITNTNNYHAFFDQNNIAPHMYQLEQGEAHTWTAFNRSLYHFVQRIFPAGTGLIPEFLVLRGKTPKSLLNQSGRILLQGTDPAGFFALDGRRVPRFSAPVLPEAGGRP